MKRFTPVSEIPLLYCRDLALPEQNVLMQLLQPVRAR